MSKLCLVTGATGMVGSYLVEHLLAQGKQVRIVSRSKSAEHLSAVADQIEWVQGDVQDAKTCKAALEDVCELYHCASHRNNLTYHLEQADTVYSQNIALTDALIEHLPDTIQQVVFFSTANITPDEVVTSSEPDGYKRAKFTCEQHWQQAAKQKQIALLIVRPVSIYGPRDAFTKNSNVVPALITKAAHATEYLGVWGDGTRSRPFVYVTDVIQALSTLVKYNCTDVQYISSPQATTIQNLATTIIEHVNPKLQIRFDHTKPNGYSVPAPPLHDVLRPMEWTPLSEGIAHTVTYYNSHIH